MKEYIEREAALDIIGVENNRIWNEVYDLPAADVAPVVNGRWDDLEDAEVCSVKCSNCGQVLPEWYSDFNYCPNCGAKMDGGAECTSD